MSRIAIKNNLHPENPDTMLAELEAKYTPERQLDSIIRLDAVLTEMELSLAKRKAPFDAAELALFTRLERILKKAKVVYMTT